LKFGAGSCALRPYTLSYALQKGHTDLSTDFTNQKMMPRCFRRAYPQTLQSLAHRAASRLSLSVISGFSTGVLLEVGAPG
jgi:hypothetical protein